MLQNQDVIARIKRRVEGKVLTKQKLLYLVFSGLLEKLISPKN